MRKSKKTPMAVAFQNAGLGTSIALAVLMTAGSLSTTMAVAENAKSEIYDFDIPAQKLNDALQALAFVSQHKLLYSSKLVDGKESPLLKGKYTAAEAVAKLLSGTTLSYQVTTDGLVVIRAAAVDSIGKLDGEGHLAGKSEHCAGISSAELDSAVALNWTASDRSSDCVDGYSRGLQVLASVEGDAVQNSGGDSNLNMESTGSAKLEEIVVTAQRRKEVLQDVPIAITVLGGDELDSSTFSGVSDALRTVPGLVTATEFSGQTTTIALRGIPASAGAASVAYYIDGVPFGFIRSARFPADPSIYDLERIEVLAGPQGTLYGANAFNGVVRILTAAPDLDAFGFKARTFTSGTTDGDLSYGGDLGLNLPIVGDRFGARLVLGTRSDGGWVDGLYDDDINSSDVDNVRLKLKAKMSDTLSVGASAWRSGLSMNAPSYSGEDLRIDAVAPEPVEEIFNTYGFNINKEFAGLSLNSQTSYISFEAHRLTDGRPAGVNFFIDNNFYSEVFSQEINLVSNVDGPWRWSAGVFYREVEDITYQRLLNAPSGTQFSILDDFTDVSESYAAYGEIGRSLATGLDLAVGLRYFHDEQAMHTNQLYANAGSVPVGQPFESTSEATTPRLVLTWTPTPQNSFYASYAQGFHSGFSQGPRTQHAFANYAPVDPDTLTNYEVGTKGTLFDSHIAYEAAAYYIVWEDVQRSITVLIPSSTPGGPTLSLGATVNSSDASGPGASLSLTTRPFDGFEIGGNVSWNDVTYDQDVFSGATLLGRGGERLQMSPEFTASFFSSYEWGLGGGFSANASLSANYRGDFNSSLTSAGLFEYAPESMFVNTRLTIGAPKNWSMALFVDNLTNDTDSEGEIIPSAGRIADWESRLRPRTYGIQLSYRY